MSHEPIEIGTHQTLTVVSVDLDGVYLGPHEIWMPRSELEAGVEVGQDLEVFVASDKEGTALATTQQPFAQAGEFAFLEVIDVVPHGAYLDWGLSRDLFLPNFLQFNKVQVGTKVMVAIDVDEQGRLFGSNRLVDYFDDDLSELSVGQEVSLWVFGSNDRGWLVIVNGTHAGLVYTDQVFRKLKTGLQLQGWVRELREDGKVDVSLQRSGRGALNDAQGQLWAKLEANDGYLSLTDKSPPEVIKQQLQMSKKAFKKALGGLYRERKVLIEPDGIRIA